MSQNPLPKQDKIVENVLEKYRQRSQLGIKKYNTTLEENDKDDYLLHLQQELMDASLYIEKLMSKSCHKSLNNSDATRLEKLEILAKLLAKTWFYGDWEWETPNERIMQMLMQELGYYPFNDEDEMIKCTGIHDELYKKAVDIIPIRKPRMPLMEHIGEATEMIDHSEQHLEMVEKSEKPINLTSSQTEISDEEIDRQAEPIEQGIYRMFFKTGAKWYREQLKKKQ